MEEENLGQRDRERKMVEIVRRFLLAFRTFCQIYNVPRRVEQEFPGRRKGALNRDLAKRARAIQRQLDKMIPPRPVPSKI